MQILNRVHRNVFRPVADFARNRFDREFATNVVSFSMLGILYGTIGAPLAGASTTVSVLRTVVGATTNALRFGTAIIMSQAAANALVNGAGRVFNLGERRQNMA